MPAPWGLLAVEHEDRLAKEGKPVVARDLPKIPADPPLFSGVMDLNWHDGVEDAILRVQQRVRILSVMCFGQSALNDVTNVARLLCLQEKKLDFEKHKAQMSPPERAEARKLKFLRPVPTLRSNTLRYAEAERVHQSARKLPMQNTASKFHDRGTHQNASTWSGEEVRVSAAQIQTTPNGHTKILQRLQSIRNSTSLARATVLPDEFTQVSMSSLVSRILCCSELRP